MSAVYYPSCVCAFTLRFDEAMHLGPTVQLSSNAIQAGNAALNAVDRAKGLQSLNAMEQQLREQGQLTNNRGQRQELLILDRADKNQSFIYGRVPKRAAIDLPGYRAAGTFNLTMDFRELPIDPRVVRSCAVDIHLGAVPAGKFGHGQNRLAASGQRLSVLTPVAPNGADNGTLVLRGLVDEWTVEHGEDGSTVNISGRDLRGLLLDTPIGASDPKASQFVLENLDLSKPVDDVVRQLLSYNPMFKGFEPLVHAGEWPGGKIPAPGTEFAVSRHRRGASGERAGGRANPPGAGGSSRMSYWDAIVHTCYLVGAIPYFVGAQLLIRPARGIYAQQQGVDGNTLVPAPFKDGLPRARDRQTGRGLHGSGPGGAIAGGPLRIRRMVYGRDIAQFSMHRKLGGYQRPHTVRAIAVDASSPAKGAQRMVEARWPPVDNKKAAAQKVAPGGKQAQEEFINVPVSGTRSVEQLLQIARGVYEEIGRGEIGGSCSTPNLASFGGDNSDPDLLRLKPGDAVEFLVDQRSLKTHPALISTLTDNDRRSFESQVAEVAQIMDGDRNLARVIVATARGAVQELQTAFRVSSVRYDWTHDNGLKVDFEYQNYVTARADAG